MTTLLETAPPASLAQIEALRMLRKSGKLSATVVNKILDENPRRLHNI